MRPCLSLLALGLPAHELPLSLELAVTSEPYFGLIQQGTQAQTYLEAPKKSTEVNQLNFGTCVSILLNLHLQGEFPAWACITFGVDFLQASNLCAIY